MLSDFAVLIERTGLSHQEVADLCGVSLTTIYRWAAGKSKPQPLATRKLAEIASFGHGEPEGQQRLVLPEFRYIDLFAGIGGFRRAFDAIGGECVFTSEWDKSCRTTYQANFACRHEVAGDIREYTECQEALKRIPSHDVLVAGFPCQPFSIAGVSKKNALGREHGFRDLTQGTLFFDLARIIEHHRPAAFLLENVRNLVSHDKGNTFRVIRHTLEHELGYRIGFRLIDSRSWVPQGRKRILIAGFREDIGFDFESMTIPDPKEGPTLGNILHGVRHAEPDELPYTTGGKVADKYTLSPGLWQYLRDYKKKHNAAGNGFGFGLVGPDDIARTLSARYYKDGSEILVRRGAAGQARPRRLTPRECARLMGFDRPGESSFVIPVSDTQAYKQFGNSVVVPMAVTVAQHMKPYILDIVRGKTAGQPELALELASANKPVRKELTELA